MNGPTNAGPPRYGGMNGGMNGGMGGPMGGMNSSMNMSASPMPGKDRGEGSEIGEWKAGLEIAEIIWGLLSVFG